MEVASVANQDARRLVLVAMLMTNAAQAAHVTKFVILVSHQYQVVQAVCQIVLDAVVLCVSVPSTDLLAEYPAEITIVYYKYCIVLVIL